jgi:chromatin remodeling complex protein RSC6
MARTKTSKPTETEQSQVPTPVVVAPTAPVNAAPEKKPRKSKASNVEPPAVVSAPVVEQTVAPVDESTTLVEGDTLLAEQSVEFLSKLQQLGGLIASLKAEYRNLEKKWTRELKIAQKKSSKRKRKAGNRAPSGFVKPTRISDELAKFLEKPAGSEMARTEVTRDINKYIRTHNLQDQANGRKINPDSKLAALLKLNKSDELTYFNLQRYMSPHFAKATKPEATA